jgi:hypothetical protein
MLENEKYWNNPYIHKYNITWCTVTGWILVEYGDIERVSNGGELNLIKAQYIKAWSTKVKIPWTINTHLRKWRAGG